MKLLAFNASPRRADGTTNILVDRFIEGAGEAGAEPEELLEFVVNTTDQLEALLDETEIPPFLSESRSSSHLPPIIHHVALSLIPILKPFSACPYSSSRARCHLRPLLPAEVEEYRCCDDHEEVGEHQQGA
jgi:hypothetical protein